MFVLPLDKLQGIAAALSAASTGLLDDFTMRLFQNNFTPGVGSLAADFTEADFTGYTAIGSGSWDAVYLLPSGLVAVDAMQCHFQASSSLTVPNTIYGWYMTNTAGTQVWASGRFAVPVPIAVSNAGLTFSPQLTVPPSSWGS